MDNAEASAENGPQPNNTDTFYVDLNNLELLQTIRELKDELQNVKQHNQIILELNEYILDKINNDEKDRRSAIKIDSKKTFYEHKRKKSKYHDSESS